MNNSFILAVAIIGGAIVNPSLAGVQSPSVEKDYAASIDSWRGQQAKELLAPKGWLTVSGLFWLKEGDTSIGSSKSNKIVLPKSAPANLGKFTRKGAAIVFSISNSDALVQSEANGGFQSLTSGGMTIVPIKRGERIGLRLYDGQSKAVKDFKGLKWFPIKPQFDLEATFVAYDVPKSVPITNVLGDTQMWPSPGYVTFTMSGITCKLVALDEGDQLFFNFHDMTSGKSTYPAGRFLYAPKPKGDKVDLDFNKATNPPCAFTAFATCPLPPLENFLQVEIPAGEKVHHPAE